MRVRAEVWEKITRVAEIFVEVPDGSTDEEIRDEICGARIPADVWKVNSHEEFGIDDYEELKNE